MKKNTFNAALKWVTLALFAGLAGCSLSATAADIPASAIGDYVGASNSIRIEPTALSGQTTSLEVKATRPNVEGSRQTTGLSTVLGCPNEWTRVPLTQWGGEHGNDKASMNWERVDWHNKNGNVVSSYGWGLASAKHEADWIRITSTSPTGAMARIGTFAQLGTPDGGTPIALSLAQALPQFYSYPGCGAQLQPIISGPTAECPRWKWPYCT